MFTIGLFLCLTCLLAFGISGYTFIDGFSTYFWQEPALIALFFGSIILFFVSLALIGNSETWAEFCDWIDEKNADTGYKALVAKYQATEHFTNPNRKDLQRFYGSASQKIVLDKIMRDSFGVSPSNAYYKLLEKEDIYAQVENALDRVYGFSFKWEDSLAFLKSQADKGNNVARVAVYKMYHYGVRKAGEKDCIEQDEKLAMKYLTPAIKEGYVNALEQLVWAEMDVGNYKQAIELMEKYALKGTHVYYVCWAKNYEYGYTVDVNYEKALAYYRKTNLFAWSLCAQARCLELLHRNGEAMAIYRDMAKTGYEFAVGAYARLLYHEFGKRRKAFTMLQDKYEKGSTDGGILFQLAYYYAEGLACKKDVAKAVELYKILVDRNDKASINNLAALYDKDDSYTDEDIFALYLKAAELGDARAMSNVGWAYINGKGVQKDEKKAVEYFQKSADLNDSVGIYALGRAYLSGWGVAKNMDKAMETFKKASHDESCQYVIGAIYYDKNLYVDAKKWFLAFLETVHRKKNVHDRKDMYKSANFSLGYIYDGEHQYSTALSYYKVAAEYGSAVAMHNIGVFYERGFGVEKNQETANYWYDKARANGFKK